MNQETNDEDRVGLEWWKQNQSMNEWMNEEINTEEPRNREYGNSAYNDIGFWSLPLVSAFSFNSIYMQ